MTVVINTRAGRGKETTREHNSVQLYCLSSCPTKRETLTIVGALGR
jgi:hypothetical protein